MRAPSSAVVAPTCDAVLDHDLPGLDVARRREVVDFVCRRLTTLPTHMRWGVAAIAVVVDAWRRTAGPQRLVALSKRPLPLLGEYFRLIRSLSIAYIWEKWPDTQPDGRIP